MEIVINHLTRMQKGYFCVAGVDVETDQHIRPVFHGRLTTDMLTRYGGPFDMGVLVDLGDVKPRPQRPEVEDHFFYPLRARALRTVEPEPFWELLQRVAKPKLSELFGRDLQRNENGACFVDEGQGKASLGCYVPQTAPRLTLKRWGSSRPRISMAIGEGEKALEVGVTDIRLYGDDHVTPHEGRVERARIRLEGAGDVILGVGLGRLYRGFHWLQVNNLHFKEAATWQLG